MHKFDIFYCTKTPFNNLIFILVLIVLGLIYSGCLEEDTFLDPTEELSFSLDTVRFDTVFTSIGSATRSVRLINNSNENISLSSIRFESNELSKFRMNVDGNPGESFSDIQIRANDSLYIFIEVTIDPDEPISTSPFVITDAILIDGGNISQRITLEAWGQNANYIPNRFNASTVVRLTCNNNDLIWDDPKPYVIYGIIFIDSCNIVLPAGADVYVHGGLANFNGFITFDGALFFQKDGKLTSKGTLDDPVVFQGDRLEDSFRDVEGQWGGIVFQPESGPHSLEHTIIKNSVIGVRADSAAMLSIDKSQIFNTSSQAVIGQNAEIKISNSLFHSNGSVALAFDYGGNYEVSYTTVANYGNQDPGLVITNFRVVDPNQNLIDILPLKASFSNCIFLGNEEEEIFYQDALEGMDPEFFELTFQNCLLKGEELIEDAVFQSFGENIIWSMPGDSTFVSRFEVDYHLHPISPALDRAIPIQDITQDLEENNRDPINPDIGCYEAQ